MRILGLDGGMASIGWAVIDLDLNHREGAITACGTQMFSPPEGQSSTGSPVLKNAERRAHCSQRKIVRRRRRRMADIRSLFKDSGLLEHDHRDALAGHGADPWELRAQALDRVLQPRELALALGHIAKHRGFKSNRKGEKIPNVPPDAEKSGGKSKEDKEKEGTLHGVALTRQRLGEMTEAHPVYRTVGEMFARDSRYADRKRNRTGDYRRSIGRDEQAREVTEIVGAQRRLGNPLATMELERAFTETAFSQLPLQSSLELVGECPFVETEKRASAFAPSFERFRLLSKLVTLRIVRGGELHPLEPDEIRATLAHFGSTKSYTWKALRKALGLSDDEKFDRIGPEKEGKDFVRSKGAAAGTKTLVDILVPVIGEVETKSLLARNEPLDAAMTAIAFNEDTDTIREALAESGLPDKAVEALSEAALDGAFDFVKGAGHISCAAARRLNPHLEKGLRYDLACAAESWDHAAQRECKLTDIKSPVAQKAAREMLKQVKVLEREYGPFDRVHVEMAREVGKGIEERGKIERGINKRTAERQKSEAALKDLLKIERVTGEDILRYELWREQNCRCIYTGEGIPAPAILASDNRVQIDHILPFSRFADNSFLNKTLCFTTANQNKKNRTPFEWKSEDDPDDWERFRAEVESLKGMKGTKKRNYLLMDGTEREEGFRARNLNDTRYALRVVLGLLRRTYPDFDDGVAEDGKQRMRRRVYARPGAITAALRRVWGVESLKKDENGERKPDDRHHALDAIITACCSEGLLQQATGHAQEQERRGEKFELRDLPPPWGAPGQFRREVEQAVASVFVSRPESGRLRGKAHDATIKQIREIDGEEKLFERKAVDELKPDDLDRIPVPEPYGKIADPKKLRDQMVENLRTWMEAKAELEARIKAIKGKSEEKTALQQELAALKPRSPKGDVIRKVRLEAKNKLAVKIRGGSADRADMVRVDVFTKPNRKGVNQFYLVPIYRNDVYNDDDSLKESPPNRAVMAYKSEGAWPVMNESFSFKFSLYSFSLIEVTRPNGEVLLGYFRGTDCSTGAITMSAPENALQLFRGIGAKTLLCFKKLHVDRLGNIHEIKQETRTWRGKACT